MLKKHARSPEFALKNILFSHLNENQNMFIYMLFGFKVLQNRKTFFGIDFNFTKFTK